jgi:hypothetical protein
LASGTAARESKVRHDRPCDAAQDHPEKFNFNPEGGNAVMLGGCEAIGDVPPVGRAAWWGAFNCGYFAYRKNKKRDANPYSNEDLKDGWGRGWDTAAKTCTSGKLPFPEAHAEVQEEHHRAGDWEFGYHEGEGGELSPSGSTEELSGKGAPLILERCWAGGSVLTFSTDMEGQILEGNLYHLGWIFVQGEENGTPTIMDGGLNGWYFTWVRKPIIGGAILSICPSNDAKSSKCRTFINQLADEGLAVVVISSYLPEIMNLSDRILVTRQGRVVEEFTAREATEERIMYAAVH